VIFTCFSQAKKTFDKKMQSAEIGKNDIFKKIANADLGL